MYNLLTKKYYLKKIFVLSLPKNRKSNITCFFMCKYTVKNTPYSNISLLLKEISRLFSTIMSLDKKNFLFVCSNAIYLYNFTKINKLNVKIINNFSSFRNKKLFLNFSSAFLYNIKYNKKIIVNLKDKKILTVGFINFYNQPKITDFTLLLETKFFSSIFLFHFILKKLIYNAKN